LDKVRWHKSQRYMVKPRSWAHERGRRSVWESGDCMGTMMEIEDSGPVEELFALTDEQILGIEEAEAGGGDAEEGSFDSGLRKARTSAQDDKSKPAKKRGEDPRTENLHEGTLLEDGRDSRRRKLTDESVQTGSEKSEQRDSQESTQTGVSFDGAQGKSVPLEAPKWLAERMKDPWHGEEARELWEGAQRAQREAGEYREVFASPAEARALKELYPGGVGEAKAAVERARQLEEIDAAYFGGEGKAPEELSAGRAQLAQRLMEQDPAAFREMVMAGVRLLGKEIVVSQEGARLPRSLDTDPHKARSSAQDDNRKTLGRNEANDPVDARVATEYRGFERAANEELERRVGGTIEKTMEQALPNLGRIAPGQQGAELSERLKASVREEVDAALRSDRQLGEQVARVLAGRRFDDATRGQVVRLIDARAQQLVPGAVRRVVSGWTQTAMAARRGEEPKVEMPARRESVTRTEKKAPQVVVEESRGRGNEKARRTSGRVNYGRLSDEDILEL
jgi:hypothetical protein